MKTGQLKVGVQLTMIAILLAIGFFFNANRINDFPIYTHAWAQSDRYALAEGFDNNNYNLFKPEGLVYNHQFPDDWQTAEKTTRTAVDFPIHDYTVACLMKVFGTTDPWVFRSYVLLYGILGLFFLFRLSFSITGNVWRSAFVTLFGASSPVFIFYQAGFLPSIPSLSNAIIAVYFYINYQKNDKTTSWNWMVLFFILAALSRTTFIIPFIAVLGVEFFRIIKGKTKLWNKLPSVILGFTAVIGYMIYNAYLRNTYGSYFLYHLMPAKDFNQFLMIINDILDNVVWVYFSFYHYVIFALALALALILGLWMRFKLKLRLDKTNTNLVYFSLLYLLGASLFIVFMIGQMNVHDYYFLDSLFLPSLIVLSLILALIPTLENQLLYGFSICFGAIALVFCFMSGIELLLDRTERLTLDELKHGVTDFEGSDLWLDKQNVSRSAKILVMDSPTPNTPFILMNRKGFTTHRLSDQILTNSQTWDYDYVVFQNKYFYNRVLSVQADFLRHLEFIASNGKLTLCRQSKAHKDQSVIDFMGLKTRKPILEEKLMKGDIVSPQWEVLHFSSDENYIYLNKEDEYGGSFSKSNWAKLKNGPSALYTSLDVNLESAKETFIVVSVTDKDESVLYYSYPLHENVVGEKDWRKVEFYTQLPQVKHEENKFSIFLFNKGTKKVMVKDWEFRITDFD